MNPSGLVNFQISSLGSRGTSEHGETVPELLQQRAENKNKIQNSHPQSSQTPHTSNCKQSPGPGRSSQIDTGSRSSEAVGSRPATEARVPGLVCPCWHVQSRRAFSFCNIHIAQGRHCLRRETEPKTKYYQAGSFPQRRCFL